MARHFKVSDEAAGNAQASGAQAAGNAFAPSSQASGAAHEPAAHAAHAPAAQGRRRAEAVAAAEERRAAAARAEGMAQVYEDGRGWGAAASAGEAPVSSAPYGAQGWGDAAQGQAHAAPEAAEPNPYAAPRTGAVGVRPEQVGPHARAARAGKDARRSRMGEGVPGQPRRRKRRAPMIALVLIAVVALVGAGAWMLANPPFYNVTINGVERMVKSGFTIQDALDEGYASPAAGNLMAVDGSVAQQGGGDKFSAQVGHDTTTDASYVIPRGASITISDGADTTESYTEHTETIPVSNDAGVDKSLASSYYVGPIHIYSTGEEGEKIVRTGDVSGKQVTEVTKPAVSAGYHAYTANVGDDKVVALTFDDGPTSTYTPEILDILKENDAHATFFQIGNQVASNATLEKRIHSEGHQLATHTWDHAAGSGGGVDLTKMSAADQVEEVEKGFAAIEDTLGTSVSRIMRAPGGNYYGSLIDTLKDEVTAEIGWNVDTEDWRRPGADAIAQAILSVKPGQVVLMHDGGGDRSQTVEALRQALPQLKAQGYKFVTIDELLAYGMPED